MCRSWAPQERQGYKASLRAGLDEREMFLQCDKNPRLEMYQSYGPALWISCNIRQRGRFCSPSWHEELCSTSPYSLPAERVLSCGQVALKDLVGWSSVFTLLSVLYSVNPWQTLPSANCSRFLLQSWQKHSFMAKKIPPRCSINKVNRRKGVFVFSISVDVLGGFVCFNQFSNSFSCFITLQLRWEPICPTEMRRVRVC